MAGGTFREILGHTGESHTALSLETRAQIGGRTERVIARREKQAEAGEKSEGVVQQHTVEKEHSNGKGAGIC